MSEQADKLTAWQVWLHPGRTRDIVKQLREELQGMLVSFEHERAELNDKVGTLQQDRSRLQAENTELSLRYKKLEEDYNAQEDDIEEIQAMFEQVKDMKAKYEARIQKLKGRVADLERALRMYENSQTDISPLPPLPKREQKTPEPPKPTEPDTGTDWYLPLDLD